MIDALTPQLGHMYNAGHQSHHCFLEVICPGDPVLPESWLAVAYIRVHGGGIVSGVLNSDQLEGKSQAS